jgi:hypothetical protein
LACGPELSRGQHDERLGSCTRHGRERALQLVGIAHLQEVQLEPQSPGRALGLAHERALHRRTAAGSPQHGHPRDLRHRFLEQFHPFPGKALPGAERDARDVATRPRQAGNQPVPHRIDGGRHHDGDRAGRVLGRADRWRACRHDDVYREPDQLSGQIREAVVVPFCRTGLNCEVLALQVAEVPQALAERLPVAHRVSSSAAP